VGIGYSISIAHEPRHRFTCVSARGGRTSQQMLFIPLSSSTTSVGVCGLLLFLEETNPSSRHDENIIMPIKTETLF
jgi:hypothetical protein